MVKQRNKSSNWGQIFQPQLGKTLLLVVSHVVNAGWCIGGTLISRLRHVLTVLYLGQWFRFSATSHGS